MTTKPDRRLSGEWNERLLSEVLLGDADDAVCRERYSQRRPETSRSDSLVPWAIALELLVLCVAALAWTSAIDAHGRLTALEMAGYGEAAP